ncbi:MAG TPA: hypothetical protein VFJ18_03185 [Pararhizobium sp.]|nr:hypothetical protein [Pararhizobium sp.]
MMKPRRFGTIADAVSRVIEAVGYDACCAALSVSKSTLYRWSDEDCRDLPNADQIAMLDALAERAGMGRPISAAIAGRVDLLTGGRPEHVPAAPVDRIADALREVAESICAYRVACHDRATPVQIDDALREIAEAREQIDLLERDLLARREGMAQAAGALRAVRS